MVLGSGLLLTGLTMLFGAVGLEKPPSAQSLMSCGNMKIPLREIQATEVLMKYSRDIKTIRDILVIFWIKNLRK